MLKQTFSNSTSLTRSRHVIYCNIKTGHFQYYNILHAVKIHNILVIIFHYSIVKLQQQFFTVVTLSLTLTDTIENFCDFAIFYGIFITKTNVKLQPIYKVKSQHL